MTDSPTIRIVSLRPLMPLPAFACHQHFTRHRHYDPPADPGNGLK